MSASSVSTANTQAMETNLQAEKMSFDRKVLSLFVILFTFNIYFFAISLTDQFWNSVLNTFFYLYFSVSLFRFGFHSYGYFFHKSTNIETKDENLVVLSNDPKPLISILIPAYNESKNLLKVLQSFINFKYSNFEIVFVDDGSKDNTFKIASAFQEVSPYPIQIFTIPNGGKSGALNHALNKAKGDFVLCMDADSTLKIENLNQVLKQFEKNPKLGAVAGVVKISTQKTLLAKFQNLDYLIGHFQRKTLSMLGKVTVIPGPIGLFRKQALLSVEGYEKENKTFAEDAELTLRLMAKGWQIQCCDSMVAFTEGPQNIQELVRQRYRWSRGLYQALFKNFKTLLYSEDEKNLIALIYLLWEQIINPILDFSILFIFTLYFIFGDQFNIPIFFVLALLGLDLLMTIMATNSEKNKSIWLMISPLSRLSYQ